MLSANSLVVRSLFTLDKSIIYLSRHADVCRRPKALEHTCRLVTCLGFTMQPSQEVDHVRDEIEWSLLLRCS
jgi:hypothetical protein